MSRRDGNYPRLDLKLNISPPPRRNPLLNNESPNRSPEATSHDNSCVSSSETFNIHGIDENSSETTSMMLVGCPNCLIYVMLSQEDPRYPKCKSSVLLNVSQENLHSTKRTTNKKTQIS
ncbi:hypothetical protein LIER_08122 [Lithospermum erythrorhizon]|uniref:GIR1-like zinc ribbon domain-containing protein n=1 Tax=Lithospermum erythrorhizon TaxID=34254 RepID=A0AAV3PBU4_LITER